MKTNFPLLRPAKLLLTALLLLSPLAQAEPRTALGAPLAAEPGTFALKIEAGPAFSLTAPQSERFSVGGAQMLKGLWTLTPWLDVGPSVGFLGLPSRLDPDAVGTAWTFGAGARLKRPHHTPDDDALFGLSPWVDVDALYVRTGALNRPGFAAAAGVALPLGERRVFWLGPFVRYTHIFQFERAGFDNHDANLLTIGLSLEVGTGVEREHVAVVPPEPRTVTTTRETFSCPDRDADGIPDNVDHCPEVAGPMDFWGCPAYQRLVVKRDKLELKEKLYFGWNSTVLDGASTATLDEVAQALNDNKNFKVQVEGHTSSEGNDDRNQTLSESRAEAVLAYLVAHGVDKSRLVSKGFASSMPRDTNRTPEGRENNRRVEFTVDFIIIKDGNQ